jgi:ABC-type nitrate/sulfonate/bicarbonate transport system substrate-binding protein
MKPTENGGLARFSRRFFCCWRPENRAVRLSWRPARVACSALSAGIGVLWLTHEQGIFRKHGLESNLVYLRSGTTAARALLAGEIQFGHLSPAL